MERSVLGSAVKTYGNKTSRYSRSTYSYRPSGLIGSCQNIFDDEDVISPFDRLLHEDKTKQTFVTATPLKSTFNGTFNTLKTSKFQSLEDQRSSTLKNVQNVRNDSAVSTKNSTNRRFCGSSKSYANKENSIKCRNQLFLSDSDSSENDVFDYSKTGYKKNVTITKQKRKKDSLGLKNPSRIIKKTNKYKQRLEYRKRCKNEKSKNSGSSKCLFVKFDADGDIIPVPRRTLVNRNSACSFAKSLDAENTKSEINFNTFKSMFGGLRKYAEKLENSDQSSSITRDSASVYVSVDITSEKYSISNLRLSPIPNTESVIDRFCPVQISTPRQSAKYDFKISAPSPIFGKAIYGSNSEEFDLTDLSKSLQFIKNRMSDRNKESSLCEAFEKSCSFYTKQAESDLMFEKEKQSCGSPHGEIWNLNGSGGVEIAKENVSGETNRSQTSCNVSSPQSDFKISSADDSFEKTQKNDETESQYMSIELPSSADHSESNVTVEMKSPVKFDSNCERNASRKISPHLIKSWSLESNALSDFSDSADEKFETIVQREDITKSTGSETYRNSAYVDSLLLSVLHSSSIKSTLGSGSSRSFIAPHLPLTESSSTKTSFSSPSSTRSSLGSTFSRSFITPHLPLTESSSTKTSFSSPSSTISSLGSAFSRSFITPHLPLTESSSTKTSFSSPSSTRSSLGSAFSRSSVAPHLPLTRSSCMNVSLDSFLRTSLNSDSSGSDELTLTVLEKICSTPMGDVSSPEFAGFETSTGGVTKLAIYKGELDKLQNPNCNKNISSSSKSSSPSNDFKIREMKRIEGSVLNSVAQGAVSYSRRRYAGILRREASFRSRKSVTFDTISTFEPVLEEKAEDSSENEKEVDSCENIKPQEYIVPRLQNRGNFTVRRRKRCPLPTLSETDSEIDGGFASSQNSILNRISSVCEENQTFVRSPIFLAKGKKWRRSFLMLKNVRDFGFNPDLSEEENKGRCWRQNVEHLIQSQLDATVLSRELDECTVLRTGFDGKTTSGFEEGDTLTEKSVYSRRTRFSLSICIDQSRRHEITQNSILDESSLARLAHERRESFWTEVNVSAGDHLRNYSLPCIDFSVPHTARDIVLRYCQQSQPLPFEECFDESLLRSCKKIGEGVYGEVFSLKTRLKSSVIKIIPIEGVQKVNGERQKRFDEILSELVISLELSNLRRREDYYTNCFAEVQRCWCVQGRYPTRLISLWKEYDQTKGSDNDSPKIFKDDQLYIILQLNNGGEDLESFEFNNAQQTLSVFKQVANALAVAEQAFKFEHRDLHWGNILVSPTKDREASFIFGDKNRNVQLFGVKVTIIDYTLSRISVNNHTLYNNIGEDPELFTAEGDFQFEVYRLMRKEVNDIWSRYVPKTNIIWLYYLIDKMINEVRYRRDYSKIHQTNVNKLKRLYASVLNFESSCDLVENQPI